jgi:peptidoglycan/LPS O-acetylase OafA/YrhL
MLLVVSVWAAFAGSVEQTSQLRRDIPWAVFYVGNWGQILGDVPYFAGEPPLLRHLWSLAVEEQWYLLWPLAFLALTALVRSRRAIGWGLVGAWFAVAAFTFWIHSGTPTLLGGPPSLFEGVDRTNFAYLSTITRSGGLLLGAAAAFLWRPWRWPRAAAAPVGRLLDPLAAGAVTLLVCVFAVAELTEGYVYQWLLPLVSVLSLVAVMVAVHPAAAGYRSAMSWEPLVELGKRSYGLYLWSWPISVMVGATEGSVSAFLWAMVLTAVASELCYRYVETPIRTGALRRWWGDRAAVTYAPIAGGAFLVATLVVYYANVEEFDPFTGGEDAVFALAGDGATIGDLDDSVPAPSVPTSDAAIAPVPTTVPTSVRLAIVGDSQARALAINAPTGIEEAFPTIVNGGLDGCSVYDSGSIRTAASFSNTFAICDGWQDDWAEAAGQADVALVYIGAWDVFDVVDGDTVYGFDTAAGDQRWAANLQSGIDAMLAAGANVALMEVPCMRPVEATGAGVPVLPERGDDGRVAHLNDLLRWVASQYGPEVEVVDGPDEWCGDESVATDVGYRWDGVHVYRPGANLIFETVAPDLLRLAAV